MWPDVTGMPTVAQAKAMVSALYTMDYEQFGSVSIDAPTKALKAGLYAVNLASDKQFEEATFFNPAFNASHTAAAAEAGYTALIEKSAGSVRKFLASKAAVLVGYCRGFNDTRTVDGIAVQTTNGAQLIMRADPHRGCDDRDLEEGGRSRGALRDLCLFDWSRLRRDGPLQSGGDHPNDERVHHGSLRAATYPCFRSLLMVRPRVTQQFFTDGE
jgi:hypothetical protein